MKKALIGYTGFVGSNLESQEDFSYKYNSHNFLEMINQEFDLVVCAGVSAVKWMANKNPDKDREEIEELKSTLKTIKTKQFILISTIDVYAKTNGEDENFDCASQDNHAYGTHRLEFEIFCQNHFDNCLIVRLPGLFGNGLKKNVVFDLMNDNCLELINKDSSFQYYYLKNLWSDIQVSLNEGIKLVNLFTEPIPTYEIINEFFPDKVVGMNAVQAGHYDLYTKYASIWNKEGQYTYSREEVLEQLSEFILNCKEIV